MAHPIPEDEDEDLTRPFRFIATGNYLAVLYSANTNTFTLHPSHHSHGSLFYLSVDETSIIHNNVYVAELRSHPHPVYDEYIFHICRGRKYLGEDGEWVESVEGALSVQLDPDSGIGIETGIRDLEYTPTRPIIPSHSIPEGTGNAGESGSGVGFLSANGIPIPLPLSTSTSTETEIENNDNNLFTLHPLTNSSPWLNDASISDNNTLVFGGNPCNSGLAFRVSLSTRDEGGKKIRICTTDGLYLAPMLPDDLVPYLEGGCREGRHSDSHSIPTSTSASTPTSASGSCAKCWNWYTLGFRSSGNRNSDREVCLSLIPRGLESMFVFFDGAFYYTVNVLKASYAECRRVERVEEATIFQFVGWNLQ